MDSGKYQGSISGARLSATTWTCGIIFVLAIAIAGIAQAQTYQILYSFKGAKDGANPESGTLIRDSSGNLFGTAENRGAFGYGTAFRLDVTGKLTVLHQFTGGEDGA